MQRRIRKVLTSVNERTRVSYAKIATFGGLCDIDLTIIKATPPNDFPLQEKYVREFSKIFSISLSSHHAFALSFARRFSKTNSWRVALKCLLLLHRLLRTLNDNGPLRAELSWARSNGLISLDPCNFRDYSSSTHHEEYTSFVRSYARLLDETLDFDFMLTPLIRFSPLDKMKELEKVIAVLPKMQSLIDRVIDCWPKGVAASRSFLVHCAMESVLRENFECYDGFKRDVARVLDSLIELPYSSCVAAFGIYKKASLQADQLCQFHEWCKRMGYCEPREYPSIERIPNIQVRALEKFLHGMWNLSDRSPSSHVSTMHEKMSESDDELSPTSSSTTCDDDYYYGYDRYKVRMMLEKKGRCGYDDEEERDIELEPLIKREMNDDSGLDWEEMLEASMRYGSLMDYSRICDDDWAFEDFSWRGDENEWKMQACIDGPNPFYHALGI